MTASPYLTVAEAAELLRCSVEAIYEMNRRGTLPGARKLGKRLLINREELILAIEGNPK
jgi:excisionase family DNA binding protein